MTQCLLQMRYLICKVCRFILLVACIGKLPAETNDLPAKQLLYDEAGIFRKSPEKKRELEQLLDETAAKYHFACYLFTKRDLQLDHIGNVSRQLCSEYVGEHSGCVLLYDESTQHLHLSSPLSKPALESSMQVEAYVPAEWLEDQFLTINQRILSENPDLQTEDYIANMVKEVNSVIQVRLQPEPRRIIWKFVATLCAVLLLGFIALHYLVWKSNKAKLEQRPEFIFPKFVMRQRLQAKFGGNFVIRAWSERASPRVTAAEHNNYFLTSHEPSSNMRKQITGKVMMFRLMSKLHDQSLTKDEILEQYEISEQSLTKWQAIYQQEIIDLEMVDEIRETEPNKEQSKESKTLPLMPI